MGKFFITVSGTDYKGEVISEEFYLGDASEETKSACIDLFTLTYLTNAGQTRIMPHTIFKLMCLM